MIYSLTLLNKPVVNSDKNDKMGRIKAFVVDAEARRVSAIILTPEEGQNTLDIVPVESVKSIFDSAVIVENLPSPLRMSDAPGVLNAFMQDISLIGEQVLTDTGMLAGVVKDFAFREKDGAITRLSLDPSDRGVPLVDGKHILTITPVRIMVSGLCLRDKLSDDDIVETAPEANSSGAVPPVETKLETKESAPAAPPAAQTPDSAPAGGATITGSPIIPETIQTPPPASATRKDYSTAGPAPSIHEDDFGETLRDLFHEMTSILMARLNKLDASAAFSQIKEEMISSVKESFEKLPGDDQPREEGEEDLPALEILIEDKIKRGAGKHIIEVKEIVESLVAKVNEIDEKTSAAPEVTPEQLAEKISALEEKLADIGAGLEKISSREEPDPAEAARAVAAGLDGKFDTLAEKISALTERFEAMPEPEPEKLADEIKASISESIAELSNSTNEAITGVGEKTQAVKSELEDRFTESMAGIEQLLEAFSRSVRESRLDPDEVAGKLGEQVGEAIAGVEKGTEEKIAASENSLKAELKKAIAESQPDVEGPVQKISARLEESMSRLESATSEKLRALTGRVERLPMGLVSEIIKPVDESVRSVRKLLEELREPVMDTDALVAEVTAGIEKAVAAVSENSVMKDEFRLGLSELEQKNSELGRASLEALKQQIAKLSALVEDTSARDRGYLTRTEAQELFGSMRGMLAELSENMSKSKTLDKQREALERLEGIEELLKQDKTGELAVLLQQGASRMESAVAEKINDVSGRMDGVTSQVEEMSRRALEEIAVAQKNMSAALREQFEASAAQRKDEDGKSRAQFEELVKNVEKRMVEMRENNSSIRDLVDQSRKEILDEVGSYSESVTKPEDLMVVRKWLNEIKMPEIPEMPEMPDLSGLESTIEEIVFALDSIKTTAVENKQDSTAVKAAMESLSERIEDRLQGVGGSVAEAIGEKLDALAGSALKPENLASIAERIDSITLPDNSGMEKMLDDIATVLDQIRTAAQENRGDAGELKGAVETLSAKLDESLQSIPGAVEEKLSAIGESGAKTVDEMKVVKEEISRDIAAMGESVAGIVAEKYEEALQQQSGRISEFIEQFPKPDESLSGLIEDVSRKLDEQAEKVAAMQSEKLDQIRGQLDETLQRQAGRLSEVVESLPKPDESIGALVETVSGKVDEQVEKITAAQAEKMDQLRVQLDEALQQQAGRLSELMEKLPAPDESLGSLIDDVSKKFDEQVEKMSAAQSEKIEQFRMQLDEALQKTASLPDERIEALREGMMNQIAEKMDATLSELVLKWEGDVNAKVEEHLNALRSVVLKPEDLAVIKQWLEDTVKGLDSDDDIVEELSVSMDYLKTGVMENRDDLAKVRDVVSKLGEAIEEQVGKLDTITGSVKDAMENNDGLVKVQEVISRLGEAIDEQAGKLDTISGSVKDAMENNDDLAKVQEVVSKLSEAIDDQAGKLDTISGSVRGAMDMFSISPEESMSAVKEGITKLLNELGTRMEENWEGKTEQILSDAAASFAELREGLKKDFDVRTAEMMNGQGAHLEEFTGRISDKLDSITAPDSGAALEALSAMKEELSGRISELSGRLSEGWDEKLEARTGEIAAGVNSIREALSSEMEKVRGASEEKLAQVAEKIESIQFPDSSGKMDELIGALKDELTGKLDETAAGIKDGMEEKLAGRLNEFAGKIDEIRAGMATGLEEKIEAAISRQEKKVDELARNVDSVFEGLEIASLEEAMMDLKRDVALLIAEMGAGIAREWSLKIDQKMAESADNFGNLREIVVDELNSRLDDAFTVNGEKISAMQKELESAVIGLSGAPEEVLQKMRDDVTSRISDLGSAITTQWDSQIGTQLEEMSGSFKQMQKSLTEDLDSRMREVISGQTERLEELRKNLEGRLEDAAGPTDETIGRLREQLSEKIESLGGKVAHDIEDIIQKRMDDRDRASRQEMENTMRTLRDNVRDTLENSLRGMASNQDLERMRDRVETRVGDITDRFVEKIETQLDKRDREMEKNLRSIVRKLERSVTTGGGFRNELEGLFSGGGLLSNLFSGSGPAAASSTSTPPRPTTTESSMKITSATSKGAGTRVYPGSATMEDNQIKRLSYLIGRKLRQDVLDPKGEVLAAKGDTVDEAMIRKLRDAHCTLPLIRSVDFGE